MIPRPELPEWKALATHGAALRHASIRSLFEADSNRTEGWLLEAPGVRVDFSRQLADGATIDLLVQLATVCGVEPARDAMFRGEPINDSEGRPAWHTALRTPAADAAVARMVSADRTLLYEIADRLRAEHRDGRVRDVFILGIGGSDLGPRLVTAALGRPTGPEIHFISNLDPVELDEAISDASPDTTVVIAVSKSFGTLETLENLKAARQWLGAGAAERTYAVTAIPGKAIAAGIRSDRVLSIPEWVGGRFSVWSACGLPIVIAHGRQAFDGLLDGARQMDDHFRRTPLARSAPAVLAMLDVWNSNFLGYATRAVFPYSQRLHYLTPYLQQLEMESCGKSVDRRGSPVTYPTGRVVWGGPGTTAQHSVFQFLHQGTDVTPSEIILLASHRDSDDQRERLLVEFGLAQADALAFGDFALPEKTRPDKPFARCPGSRPSVVLWLADLSARSLGALLALNEHRTFARSALLDINAFDQWGVEIGKRLLAARGANP